MAVLIFLGTFIVVLLLFLALWLLFTVDSSQDVVRKRMEAVRKAERRGNVSLGVELVRDEMLSSVPAIHRFMLKWSWSTRFSAYVLQAGIRTKPAKIILMSAVLGLSSFLLMGMFYRKILLQIAAGALMTVVPLAYVAFKRRRRFKQFEEHFPEALDLLGRAVRAGHAFTTGLEMISKECPEPVSGEFRAVFEEQNFGLPLRDAVLNLGERVPLVDVGFFVTALLIQKESGGNLAEILDGLSRVIRDRFRILRDVQTRTAQGRLTAGILVALPPLMVFLLGVVNPEYMKPLFEDPAGPPMLYAAAAFQVSGAILLWKIVHIEV